MHPYILATSQAHDKQPGYSPSYPPSISNPPITCAAKSEKSSSDIASNCFSYVAFDQTSIFSKLQANTNSLPTSAYSNNPFGNKTLPAESSINSVAPLINFLTKSRFLG